MSVATESPKTYSTASSALVQDLRQFAAEDLHVPAHHLGGQVDARGAVGVDDGLPAHVGLPGVDLVPHAHGAEHPPVHMAPEVDGEAVPAQRGRLLDDGDPGAVPGEAEGEGGPGDAGAGDEDGEVAEAVCVRHGNDHRRHRLPFTHRPLTEG